MDSGDNLDFFCIRILVICHDILYVWTLVICRDILYVWTIQVYVFFFFNMYESMYVTIYMIIIIIQFSKVVSSSLAFRLRDPVCPHLQRQPPLRSDTDGSLFTLCLYIAVLVQNRQAASHFFRFSSTSVTQYHCNTRQ